MGVGKSSLLSKYVRGIFPTSPLPTIAIEFATKIIQLKEGGYVKAQIWDTAGQEKYKSLTKSYYTNAKGALLIFDISNKESFLSIDKWISDLQSITGKNIIIILIGNKSDLEIERKVSYEEGIIKAKKHNLFYLETSALLNTNIEKAFNILTEMIYQNYLVDTNKEIPVRSFIISEEITNPNEKSTCLC